MRLLFANPPTYSGEGSFNRPIRFPTYNYATPVMHPPILLAYAASHLRSRGHAVELIDAPVNSLTVREFISKAVSLSPDYVVFETSTPSFKNDSEVAREIKENLECKVVFLGTHVSALPEASMIHNSLDAIVAGEYELSLCEYIEKGGKDTRGICYKNNGQIVSNPPRGYLQDLDLLPFPARDLLPNYRYFDPILKNPFTFVFAGRGCPFKCTFCNWPQVMTGRQYRLRSPKNIADELEILDKKYKFKSFLFNDDTFTAHPKHAKEVCSEMIERGIKTPWGCYSRADNTDEELLKKLRDAGCYLLKSGVESGDQAILNNVNKNYRLEKVVEGVTLMKDLGFHVHCTFVFGLPGETHETIEKTIAFARKLDPTTVQFSTAVPYPGTELHQYLKSKGYLLTDDWDEYMPMHPIFSYPDLSSREISEAVKKAYRRYYFRPRYVKTGIKQLCSNPKVVISNVRRLVDLAI